MFGGRLFIAAIWVSLIAATAEAQSLGQVARQEEARRTDAKKAVKTLSNADLAPGAIAQPPSAEPSCYVSKSTGTCVSSEQLVSVSAAGVLTRHNAPLEQIYRVEADSLRSQIEKTQASITTLEGVIADRARPARDRIAAEKSLASAHQILGGLERNWAKLEKAVGNHRLPHKWIEPAPTLTTVKQ